MPFIPKPPFPNVPKLPGVPQVARSLNLPAGPPPALGLPVAIVRLWQSLFATPQWGVYNSDGQLVLNPDNIMDMGMRVESVVPSFPVQAGSFANYDKVALPREYYLRMTKGGNQAARTLFIESALILQQGLERVSILTPERSYPNVNLTRVEIQRRGAQGAYFLAEVDLFFTEIREVAAQYTTYAASTSNAQEPGAQPPINQGRVQGVTPPQSAAFDPADNLKVTP